MLSALSIIFRVVSDLISWFGLLVRPRKSLEAEILNKSLELHDRVVQLDLSDTTVDLIGEGFDAAIRIAVLPASSLVARTLCGMPRYLVGTPSYLIKHGRPKHPMHLAEHRCIDYAYTMVPGTWRFTCKDGESATVRPSGPLRVNNGDAMLPALIAGTGLGVLPGFICARRWLMAAWSDCYPTGLSPRVWFTG